MPEKQIFYDPLRKRWKRLRRILDAVAVGVTLIVAGFIFNTLRGQAIPELLLPIQKHNYRALSDRTPLLSGPRPVPAHRRTTRKPSQVPLNTGEGLRAAYYVPDDATSYSSFKAHVHQIDMLFPEWLHVNAPDPTLLSVGMDAREYRVIDGQTVHDPDDLDKIKRVIHAASEDTEVFPHINNYNPNTQTWDPAIGTMLSDPSKRTVLRQQLVRFFTAFPFYRGLSLDFENLPPATLPAYVTFVQELYGDLHPHNLRLYINVGVGLQDTFMKQLAANSDGIILMNYDQHEIESQPGPIAAQDWFIGNLQRVLKLVPKDKIICAIGNYGYDWNMSIPPAPKRGKKAVAPKVLNTDDLSVSDVWQRASDAGADMDLDYDTLNPHLQYIDEDENVRHVIWYLNAVTVLNQMRGARLLGLQTFALWRLGEEDSSLWNIWDRPSNPESLKALDIVQPGHDVDTEGEGDILRVTGLPKAGKRTVEIDTDEPDPRKKLIVDETMEVYPSQYTIRQYGYHPNKVAISFDDGPDPKWTPRILDVLKRKGAHGTFMLIGEEAQQNMGLMQRIVDEGNEIGNHT
ncbi:MAG TPA: polysaccharide deacetylase family protein, partial [Terracidiphilus sp.]